MFNVTFWQSDLACYANSWHALYKYVPSCLGVFLFFENANPSAFLSEIVFLLVYEDLTTAVPKLSDLAY